MVEPVTGSELVLLPAGAFRMGSDPSEHGRGEDESPHLVRLTRPFWMARREVTREAWSRVMGDAPGHFAACGPECPIEGVNAYDVEEFLARLEHLSGARYRLPTEAEWEYACRSGGDVRFATGERLTAADANVRGSFPDEAGRGSLEAPSRDGPLPGGSFPPSAWGLEDLHGNVWEWCADAYLPYPEGPVDDPLAAAAPGALRVIRGGSFHFGADSARCALRYTHRPEDCGFSLGFRLARSAP